MVNGTENLGWRVLGSYATRRRFLGAAGMGGLGIATAALIGCGDDDDEAPAATAAPTVVATAAPTTAATAEATAAAAAAATAAPTAAATAAAAAATATQTAAATAAPSPIKRGGVAAGHVGTGEQDHQDPHLQVNTINQSRGSGITYARLLRLKRGVDIPGASAIAEGWLAESWEQAPDLVTITFNIRPEAKWQNIAPVNGRDLVADDVAYSMERQRGETFLARQIADITWEVIDPKTIQLVLPTIDADAFGTLADTANKVIAREAVDVNGDLTNGPTIGAGPWIMEEWKPDELIRFKANPDYWMNGLDGKPLPYADEAVLFRLRDPATILASFRNEQIIRAATGTGGGLVSDDVERLENDIPGLQLISGQNWGLESIFMNGQVGWGRDIRVRQAISRIVKRDEILVAIGEGYWSTGPKLPELAWLLPQEELNQLLGYDPDEAAKLLDAAGFDSWDAASPFYYSGRGQTSAELVQAYVSAININATLESWDANKLVAWFSEKNIDGFVVSPRQTGASANGDLRTWFDSRSARELSAVTDESAQELDRLIDLQFGEFDLEARREILQDLQRANIARAGAIPLIGNWATEVFHPWVRNAVPGGYGDSQLWENVWFDK